MNTTSKLGAGRSGLVLPFILTMALLLCACEDNTGRMRDGYYTAESSAYDAEGWKYFLALYIKDDRIVTAEFNAADLSGMLRSWDLDYMSALKARNGVYPTRATRTYVAELINKQNPAYVWPVYGDIKSYKVFKALSEAAVAQARAGSGNVVLVNVPEGGASSAGLY